MRMPVLIAILIQLVAPAAFSQTFIQQTKIINGIPESSSARTVNRVLLADTDQISTLLPLKLVSFTGKEVTGGVYLQWSTAGEDNTEAFDIERSRNSGAFNLIGSVPSKKASARYSFTDNNSIAGTVYLYRLKMRDIDGQFTYSPVTSIKLAARTGRSFRLFPNPLTGASLYLKPLQLNHQPLSITMKDLAGKTWYKQVVEAGRMNDGNFSIPVHMLPAGTYVLQVSDGSERTQTFTFTK